MMTGEIKSWLDSGKYLPEVIRDFHDQKDLFKAIHDTIAVEKHEYCKDISWVAGQCYVVDIFLWYMAKRGYTLQKTRTKLPFRNLDDDVAACKEAYAKALSTSLGYGARRARMKSAARDDAQSPGTIGE